MGVVYEAMSAGGDRVALKVIAPEHVDDVEFEQRFRREAELAARIEHPHVVRVIDSGHTTDGRPYLAFAYIDGTDLDRRLREHGAMLPGHAGRTVAQVASALDAAHHGALVHRDVKPANVVLDRDGNAFLADFGLVRPLTGTRFTCSGAWLGTVDYASPEQIEGHQVDARADIYALAAMTFQMLSGTVPFARDSDIAKLWAHVSEERPRLPDGIEHVTVLQTVIDRGMARDPDERYLSAGDFAAALSSAAAGRTARLRERVVATGAAAPSAASTAVLATADIPAVIASRGTDGVAPTVRLDESRAPRRRRLTVAFLGVAALTAIAVIAAFAFLGPLSPLTGSASPTGVVRTAADATVTATATPTPTTTPTATATPTSTPNTTATPKPTSTPVVSPRRADDLPIVLDSDSYVPTRIGSWNPLKDASVAAAVKAFGGDYTTSVDSSQECILHWINIGLRVQFVTLFGDNPCDEGLAQTLEIDGVLSDRWRTLSGLRPDMRTSTIRKLYPRARKHGSAWWLITAYSLSATAATTPRSPLRSATAV